LEVCLNIVTLNKPNLFLQEKEELVDQILEQHARIEKLLKDNEALRKEIEKLKGQIKPSKKSPFQKEAKTSSKPPHQWGRKKGHPGSWRPVPDHIDKEVPLELAQCPVCRHGLKPSNKFHEHIQEEIIPARVEVTRYKHYEYWCGHCHAAVIAPHAPDEIPYGHLGPRVLSVMAMLKYHYVLPGNKIKAVLQELCGLKVSEGGIAQALQRLGRYLGEETEVILGRIRQAAYKHADETGWKINGKNHWLWAFVNEMWAYYVIHKSRASKVPKEVLGNPVQGILISDFHGAYGKLTGKKQKCLVHLKREMKECRGKDPPEEYLEPYRKLRRILSDATRLEHRRPDMSGLVFRRRTRRLKERLTDFACAPYRDRNWKRLSKRLLKHEDEMFTFLDFPGLPKDNNQAERLIRPHVILRNRSFQNRTEKGSQAHGKLTSIINSLILQKRSALGEIQRAYPLHRQRALLELPARPEIFSSSAAGNH